MLVFHYVDPNLVVEIFFGKEEAAKYSEFWFEIEEWGTYCTFVLDIEQNFMQAVSTFALFFMTKKEYILKITLTCAVSGLLDSFDLPSFGSKSRSH